MEIVSVGDVDAGIGMPLIRVSFKAKDEQEKERK